jgi:hypothetical protein
MPETTDSDKRTLRENGYATAMFELLSGYPGYFHHRSIGSYLSGVDNTFGLPIYNCSDIGGSDYWFDGYNNAILAYIQQSGLPWNSRLKSLDILADLGGYFNRESPRKVTLKLGGDMFRPDGLDYTLKLEWARTGVTLRLESDSLFIDPKISPDFRSFTCTSAPPCPLPENPRPPALGAATKSIRLNFYELACCLECVPAPLGSHLAICRFSDFAPDPLKVRTSPEEAFAALDTQLGDWIPAGRVRPKVAWIKSSY